MKLLKINHLAIFILLLLCSFSAQSQRLELRFNKEFSNDEMLNKILGGGASFIIDGWHEHFDFQINFDYAGHKEDADYQGISTKIAKYKGGVSALYTHNLWNHFIIRVGGDVSYNYINKVATQWDPTDNLATHINTAHRAQMLGIGAVAQLQAQLGKAFRIGLGVTPTYLIPLSAKVSMPDVECDYKKGLFVLQLQVGIEIRLVNNNDNNQ